MLISIQTTKSPDIPDELRLIRNNIQEKINDKTSGYRFFSTLNTISLVIRIYNFSHNLKNSSVYLSEENSIRSIVNIDTDIFLSSNISFKYDMIINSLIIAVTQIKSKYLPDCDKEFIVFKLNDITFMI